MHKNCFKIFFWVLFTFQRTALLSCTFIPEKKTTQNGDNLYVYTIGEVIIMFMWGS